MNKSKFIPDVLNSFLGDVLHAILKTYPKGLSIGFTYTICSGSLAWTAWKSLIAAVVVGGIVENSSTLRTLIAALIMSGLRFVVSPGRDMDMLMSELLRQDSSDEPEKIV